MSSSGPYELATMPLWATPFFVRMWADHPRQAPEILSHLYGLRDRQATAIASGVAQRAKAGQGLYESPFDLFADPHPPLQALVGFIRETLAEAVSRVNRGEVPPTALDVEFPDSWYHITTAGGFHDTHAHGGCSWCGIYYLRIGASGPHPSGGAPNGGSRFYSPLLRGGGYTDYGNKYLTPAVDPPIADSLLLLFPSYLLHSGLPYTGPVDRVVLAFNARVFVKESADRANRVR